MPEKHDLLAAILAAKGTRHRGNPCVCNGVPFRAADIMAVRLQKNSNRRKTMCAIIAQFIRDLLDSAGLSSNFRLYNERVYRLHRY